MALILRMLDNQQLIDLVSGDLCDSGRWRVGDAINELFFCNICEMAGEFFLD